MIAKRELITISTKTSRASESGTGSEPRRTNAMKLAVQQRLLSLSVLRTAGRSREAVAGLEGAKAGVEAEREEAEADVGSIRYLAVLRWADGVITVASQRQ
jgi:hypothetical protein